MTTEVETTADGLRSHCFFCGATWGACTCEFPDQADLAAYAEAAGLPFDLGDLPGFDFGGKDFWITDPGVSVCGRFYVDPLTYYGEELRSVLPKLADVWRKMAGDPSSVDRLLAQAGVSP